MLADESLRGRSFGAALCDAVDAALVEAFADADVEAAGEVAVVGLGSYARRELCPASDIDVLLVHNLRGRRSADTVRSMTEQLWYPLWDAGFVTGHGARTIKESIALADDDLDALTALLDVRVIAGSRDLAQELERKARELAARRQARILPLLADAVDLRRQRPGAIAEMLEPDLKEGAGGLRDVQSLEWGGWALGEPGGVATLIARGLLAPADLARVEAGRELLLDIRVALQRATNSRSDRLPLQEHDAVAARLDFADADALVHDLARARARSRGSRATCGRACATCSTGPGKRRCPTKRSRRASGCATAACTSIPTPTGRFRPCGHSKPRVPRPSTTCGSIAPH